MKLLHPNTTGSHSLSRGSVFPLRFLSLRGTRKRHRPELFLGWNSGSVTVKLDCRCVATGIDSSSSRKNGGEVRWGECEECVEVIVVGSRKDGVLDFCSASPFLSPVLRFWDILGCCSEQLKLQQRFTSQDSTRTMEDFSAWQSSCRAVILVASAAYGSDHITALEVLSNVKSANGFVVGIILKPFRFEGQRRQDEVKDLVSKLEKQANFCIVLDTDALLENDLVTLDEALRTTNNAVLMAMNAISILLSEKHIKLLNTKDNSTRELQLPECREIFEGYNEASIGFGAGYNVKTSLLRAINDCPFLGVDIKDFDGAILCIIASSGVADCSDANNILNTVRAITKCKGEIIVSVVHEPNQEPNTILATIIVFGFTRQQMAPRNGIFSSLGQHFPFIFNLFDKKHRRSNNSDKAFLSESLHVSDAINPPVNGDMLKTNPLAGTIEDTGVFMDKLQPLLDDSDEEIYSISSEEGGVELLESNSTSSYELNSEGTPVFKREMLARGNLGPGWSSELPKYGSNFSEATGMVDSVSIYKLPVGVKHLEKLEDESLNSKTMHGAAWGVGDNKKKQHYARPTMSWAGSADADFNNNVSSSNNGNPTSNSKKHGVLSLRAASMLESERDSQKKWSRVVEMKYRGGIYRGRAQGGLPEGKGRLLLGDKSIYDGMWRYGKRSGMGTFYFNNGDVFQGSWRDDVMHGKGWIYFRTGDRWFANFWKGKANGEGRFYSKLGDVSFGHFKEGWRHGHFLRINVDGTRSQELWDEGVLVSEKQLDPDAEVGRT
ncbi:protein ACCUMULATION AND REPLICATION OF CHLOROPLASTS 3 [Sesamum indicum]|uniref:Protein ACCUMULATION AND REPLICATION OF CHLOROPLASTS 3 n=1 Tax=Sesamum indicum TaxID=4182 RepID=A0A6I9STH2_SESIN|nr:protein ACCUMULATION AND REPLICATION OF CHLOROPLASTS 3 [Sesamum indicum]